MRQEVQLALKQEQASMMHAMAGMMAEFMGIKGLSELINTGSRVAVGDSPRGVVPFAVRRLLLL